MKNITAFVVTLFVAVQTANRSQVLDSKFDVSPNPAQPGQSIEARLEVGPSTGKVQFYATTAIDGFKSSDRPLRFYRIVPQP